MCMMKRLLLYISMILPLLYSCNEEAIVNPALQESDTCELRFTVTIPQPSVVSSRAITDENPTISSLTLILFDENGLYKGKKEADPVTLNPTKQDDGTYEGTYTVTLGRTEEKRIIHFVANCAVGDFETNTHENVVLPTLVVDSPQDAYWQRMSVTGIGLDENKDNITDNLPDVRLIRNFVAINVTESAGLITGNDENEPFIQGYALYNEATKGTVAPYFREEGSFPLYSTDITYTELNGTQKYMGIEPSGISYDSTNPLEADFTKDEKYTYERSYSDQTNAQNPTFIVLEGLYNNETYYYRVDIAKDFKFYQLLRNFRYIININTICAGYTTIDQAIKGSSFNNLIDVGIKVEEITDGVTSLYVSPTDITVVNGTQSVEIGYKCETDLEGVTMSISALFDPEVTHPVISSTLPAANTTGIEDLEGVVTVNLIEYFKKDASNNYEVDATTGRYISTMSGNKQIQSFEIRTSNGLYRRVRINLVDKIEFNPVFVGPDSEGKYVYQYTLPDELPESMFPLEIYLYEPTNSFTPVVGQGLSVDLIDATTTSTGTWRYKKTLSYEEYLADGDKIFSYKFVANEELNVEAEYTMSVSNEYAYTDAATLSVTGITGNDVNNGVMTWYVGDEITSKTAIVQSTGESITCEIVNESTYFNISLNETK